MRLIRMNRRSRYRGIRCLHCHKPISEGRVGLASTYYVLPWRPSPRVSTQRMRRHGFGDEEICIRVVYHRKCVEKILTAGPLDPEVEVSLFEDYRDQLLQEYEEFDDDPDSEE
jgi:hypothetical protein